MGVKWPNGKSGKTLGMRKRAPALQPQQLRQLPGWCSAVPWLENPVASSWLHSVRTHKGSRMCISPSEGCGLLDMLSLQVTLRLHCSLFKTQLLKMCVKRTYAILKKNQMRKRAVLRNNSIPSLSFSLRLIKNYSYSGTGQHWNYHLLEVISSRKVLFFSRKVVAYLGISLWWWNTFFWTPPPPTAGLRSKL